MSGVAADKIVKATTHTVPVSDITIVPKASSGTDLTGDGEENKKKRRRRRKKKKTNENEEKSTENEQKQENGKQNIAGFGNDAERLSGGEEDHTIASADGQEIDLSADSAENASKTKRKRRQKRKLNWTIGNVLNTLLGRNGYAHHSNNFYVKAEPENFTVEERHEMAYKWKRELAYLQIEKFDMGHF